MTDADRILQTLEQSPGKAWTLPEFSEALAGVDLNVIRMSLWVLIDCGVVDITADRRIVLAVTPQERDR